jgi:hypothetical protein
VHLAGVDDEVETAQDLVDRSGSLLDRRTSVEPVDSEQLSFGRLGRIDESLKDIQRGLQINPESQDLQKTLAIARGYEKLQQERMKHLLDS